MLYMRLYGDYLSERRAFEALLGEDTGFPSRLDLMVGEQSPLTTLISTAVATGDAAASIREGIAAYKNLTFDVDLDVNWADGVFFGYFGPSQALDTISTRLPSLFSDAKSQVLSHRANHLAGGSRHLTCRTYTLQRSAVWNGIAVPRRMVRPHSNASFERIRLRTRGSHQSPRRYRRFHH